MNAQACTVVYMLITFVPALTYEHTKGLDKKRRSNGREGDSVRFVLIFCPPMHIGNLQRMYLHPLTQIDMMDAMGASDYDQAWDCIAQSLYFNYSKFGMRRTCFSLCRREFDGSNHLAISIFCDV